MNERAAEILVELIRRLRSETNALGFLKKIVIISNKP